MSSGKPILVMTCDHLGCKREPVRAPRLIVPASAAFLVGNVPVRVMTTLHYCQDHIGELKVSDILNDKMKAKIEAFAKRNRPTTFRPDFDRASLEYVLLTTPEYRNFLLSISIRGGAAA